MKLINWVACLHLPRRSVAASADTWRTEMTCAFPGPTATRCFLVLSISRRPEDFLTDVLHRIYAALSRRLNAVDPLLGFSVTFSPARR